MHGQAVRKKQERQSKDAERARKCRCGNFKSGEADGLCHACRAARKAFGGGCPSAPSKGPAGGPAAPAARARARAAASGGRFGSTAEAARNAVSEGCPASVAEDVVEYLADTAAWLLEDGGGSPKELRQQLEESLLPLLEDSEVAKEDASALLERVMAAAFPASSPSFDTARRRDAAVANCVHDADLLCRVPKLLLMYGGSPEPLLSDTTLELVRGRRYGVVGSNGSGKTTLMARIASKDITGFPKSLVVVHLRHEAILHGVDVKVTAREYAQLKSGGATEKSLGQAFSGMGFNEDMLNKAVAALSGGWQMRLAVACAVAQETNILLLDEPTNHLDAEGVRWLVNFINEACVGGDFGATAMIVSHDPEFLDQVCTDVIHFAPTGKLVYHRGNFAAFKAEALGGDEAEAQKLLETTAWAARGALALEEEDRILFPVPEQLGSTSAARKGPIATLKDAYFQYEGAEEPVLRGLSAELTATSQIGIVGRNGSGKSTLLALMAGRLRPTAAGMSLPGELWWQKGLRLAYIAQHSMVHLGEHLASTPRQYVELRFRKGFDEETPRAPAPPLSRKEQSRREALGTRHGKRGKNVEAILSRIEVGEEKNKECLYEVKWEDLGPAENTFEKFPRLKSLGVEALAYEMDERLRDAWAGQNPRPMTEREIVQHLMPFGLPEEVICHRKISMLSSGQRCKLALGAAFWTRPHLVCLDEPTNYLDTDTVELLGRAIRSFRGSCVVVSHSEKFVRDVCNEVWELKDGKVTVRKLDGGAAGTAGAGDGAAKGGAAS